MEIIEIRDEFIKLGQVLKLSGLAGSGVEAKELILQGIFNDDIVEFDGNKIKIKA